LSPYPREPNRWRPSHPTRSSACGPCWSGSWSASIPDEIWLFGSRAEARARPNSDYDLLAVLPDGTPEPELDPVGAWSIVRGLGVLVDLVPCTRSEFEEEKHEIDTLARAAFLRGIRLYERAA
jgi:predicted nucleotidyltransferase